MHYRTIALAVGAMLFSSLAAADGAQKTGWWVRIQNAQQQPSTITFQLSPDNHTTEAWMIWHAGDPVEFDVPAKFQSANPLYIMAQSSDGSTGWVCVMHQQQAVKRINFDADEDREENSSISDKDCAFAR